MPVPGLALSEHLPPALDGERSVLLIGGDDVIAAALCRAGYRVTRHGLDFGPLAQLAERPFTPPVVAWPFPDQSCSAVVLLDELALTMREEEALAEAGRVLRPGGVLLLRVPAAGPLAWLDGYNAYRYVTEFTKRGRPVPEVRGVGWRRHYRRQDLLGLLRRQFRIRAVRGAGLGLSDAARLGLNLLWRWLLRSARGDAAIARIPEAIARREGRVSVLGRGYWWMAAAERALTPIPLPVRGERSC
jgi:SAM-dependent methyltransferase